ncbi:MAG: hypothetical protein V3V78_02035 [Candidatus Woesearchaeota archaeon]
MKKILICTLIITILLITGCKKAEEDIFEVPEQIIPEEQEQIEEVKMLELLRCSNGAIEAVVTNTGTEAVTLAKDVKVLVNGLLVVDPACENLTISPGESTYCQDISGHLATRTGKVNTVVTNAKHERAIEYIDCAE